MAPISPRLLQLAVLFVWITVPFAFAETVNNTERYELCSTETQINELAERYNLTRVDSVPTDGALHPGWPQTLVAIFQIIVNIVALLSPSTSNQAPSGGSGDDGNSAQPVRRHSIGFIAKILSALITLITPIVWTISFGA